MVKIPNLNQRLHRWAALLIKHISAKNNILADYLSRGQEPLTEIETQTQINLLENEIHIPLDTHPSPSEYHKLITSDLYIGPATQPKIYVIEQEETKEIKPRRVVTRKWKRMQDEKEQKQRDIEFINEQQDKTKQYIEENYTTHSDTEIDPMLIDYTANEKEYLNLPEAYNIKGKNIVRRKRTEPLTIHLDITKAKDLTSMTVQETPNIITKAIEPRKREDFTHKTEVQIRKEIQKEWQNDINELFNTLKTERSHIIPFQDDTILETSTKG